MAKCLICNKIIDEESDFCERCSEIIEKPKVNTHVQSHREKVYVLPDELHDAFKINSLNISFYVYIDVMTANCGYFEALMHSNMREAKVKEVTLPDLSPSTLEEVIKFCYFGHCSITKDNMIELIVAASRLLNSKLLEKGFKFAEDNLDSENYLKLFVLGMTLERSDLTNLAAKRFSEYLELSRFCQDYTDIDQDDLYELLKRFGTIMWNKYCGDYAHYRSEKYLEAILKWYRGDALGRIRLLSRFLTLEEFSFDQRYFSSVFESLQFELETNTVKRIEQDLESIKL